MNVSRIVSFGMMLLFGTAAFAEDRCELSFGYSYLRFSPTITGLEPRAFNGGDIGVSINFLKLFAIKGEFTGYGSTSWTRVVPVPITTPSGTIPAGTYTAQGDMFTYLVGPVLRIPLPLVKPFGEALFGASNSDGYANLAEQIDLNGGTISRSLTQHPFTMAVGGGVDISMSRRISLRPAEVDYVLTKYSNPLTNTSNQNNFRYVGGIVFKF
jgi:hypothetical protein